MKNLLWILLLFFLVPAFSGCQAAVSTTFYQGAKVAAKDVISLSSPQAQQQRWQDLYVAVDYSFTHQNNQFKIDGVFSFSDSAKINYQTVSRLKLKLFLLNKDMQVVDYRDVLQVLGYSLESPDKFKGSFVLTDDVVAFTFGYDGVLRDDEGLRHPIWKLPKRGN